jgi:hypothetical protein
VYDVGNRGSGVENFSNGYILLGDFFQKNLLIREDYKLFEVATYKTMFDSSSTINRISPSSFKYSAETSNFLIDTKVPRLVSMDSDLQLINNTEVFKFLKIFKKIFIKYLLTKDNDHGVLSSFKNDFFDNSRVLKKSNGLNTPLKIRKNLLLLEDTKNKPVLSLTNENFSMLKTKNECLVINMKILESTDKVSSQHNSPNLADFRHFGNSFYCNLQKIFFQKNNYINNLTMLLVSELNRQSCAISGITSIFGFFFGLGESVEVAKPYANYIFLTLKQKKYKKRGDLNTESRVNLTSASKATLLSNSIIDSYISDLNVAYNLVKKNKKRSESISIALSKRILRTKKTLILPAHMNITVTTNSFDIIHS